ncbi:hypothetical protein JCM17960_33880 [Magnetospira thiophila]
MNITTAGGLLFVGVGLAMAAIAVTLWTGPMAEMGQTDSLQPVDLTLKGHEFQIPKAFLWYKPNWEGKVDGAIHMTAVWPDFKPYGEDTKAFFQGGLGLPYKISFDLYALAPGAHLNDLYFKPGFLATCPRERSGFKVCAHPDTPQLFDVLVRPDPQQPLALVCRKTETERSPFCLTDLPYAPGLKLVVGFHIKRLADAAEVVRLARQTVCGFRRPGTPDVALCP